MSDIDDRLARLSEPERRELQRIRQLVLRLVPGAQEVMSYGMPGFRYRDKYLLGYEAFKDHLSLFPTAEPVEALQDRLALYQTSKGTIQFTLDHPLPDDLIADLVAVRLASIDGRK